jgi:tetratricopeptide (TPR) repeat protein
MFKNAIDKDPSYARAWAGLGDAYSQMYRFGYEEAWNDSSMKASMKAIRLDSNLSEAYKSLANAYNAKRLYDMSLPFLLKALELNPRNESAVGNLGTNYFFRGDLPEALRLQKKSAEINPKKFVPYYIAGWIYGRLGDYTKAEQWLRESLKLDSTFAQTYELLAYVYVAQGRRTDALKLIQQLLQAQPKGKPTSYRTLEKAGIIAQFCGDLENAKKYYQESISKNTNFSADPVAISPIGLGQILLNEGSAVKAEVLLMHSLELNLQEVKRGSQDDDPRFIVSAAYSILGKKQESLEWLQKAIDAQWLDHDEIAYSPWFDNIKQEPRYHQLMTALRRRLDAMRKKANGL